MVDQISPQPHHRPNPTLSWDPSKVNRGSPRLGVMLLSYPPSVKPLQHPASTQPSRPSPKYKTPITYPHQIARMADLPPPPYVKSALRPPPYAEEGIDLDDDFYSSPPQQRESNRRLRNILGLFSIFQTVFIVVVGCSISFMFLFSTAMSAVFGQSTSPWAYV